MALLWMEGFDLYGIGDDSTNFMLDGVFADFTYTGSFGSSSMPRVGDQNSRTGGGALFTRGNVDFDGSEVLFFSFHSFCRRIFGGDRKVVGFGYAFFPTILPQLNGKTCLGQVRNNANQPLVGVWLTTTGQVEVRVGGTTGTTSSIDAGTVVGTSAPVITAAAYQHVEMRFDIDAVAGSVEVRVNGVTAINLTDIDTQPESGLAAQVVFGKMSGTGSETTEQPTCWWDDMFAWDDTGAQNNHFLGDRRVRTLLPSQDTAVTDWIRNTGVNDFEMIRETTPDDEATYIEAVQADDVSIFEFDDLPDSVSVVSALQFQTRMRKTEAGECQVQLSVLSAPVGSPPLPSEAAGADRPITEIWTYWTDVIELDPATGAAWSRSAVNDAQLKIARTA